MNLRYKALGVHLLTATGSALSILAILAAADGQWRLMFLWLLAALVVDAVDGPLARRFDASRNWSNYDGALMDLIIDYLTYVFVPAFALFRSGLLSGWTGWLAIIAITYASVLYFSDRRMKTDDNSFMGFPSCWNMVVLVLFAIQPGKAVVLAVVVILTGLMFTSLRFIHPVRTTRWRSVSLPVAVIWVICAFVVVLDGFASQAWPLWGLSLSSAWLLAAGILQQVIPPSRPGPAG